MIYEIRTFGDEALRDEAQRVEKIDEEIASVVEKMVETMKFAEGVGLAAPQVGINKRILVIDAGDGITRRVINPEFLEYSHEIVEREEGCLSIPGVYKKVKRPARVKVKYTNEKGVEVVEEADGLLARIFQHEVDHLNSILFVDKLSPVAKRMVARKLQILKKETLRKKKSR